MPDPAPAPAPPPTAPPDPAAPPLSPIKKGGLKVGDIVFCLLLLTIVGVTVYLATSEKE